MKNVVYIVVDALCYKSLERRIGNVDVTPFLNKLSRKSLCCTKMYTQAPYTEASLVSILSGENTLDSGGYLFGNGTTHKSIFGEYVKKGYKTIFSYSPYVFSRAYLEDVTDYFYTRLYSLEPLFLYRLEYYYDKWLKNCINQEEIEVCALLLKEAIETWKEQCIHFVNNDKECSLIYDWVEDLEEIESILAKLMQEESLLKADTKEYVLGIFQNWQEHTLRLLNKKYIKRTEFKWRKNVNLEKYKEKFSLYQKKYSRIIKNDIINVDYLVGMIFRNKNGLTDARNTWGAYKRYYSDKKLENYIYDINETAKVEVSMRRAFDVYYKQLKDLDKENQNYYAYIHMQEFHLPSVFHTLDTENSEIVEEDFKAAFSLLDKMDNNYKGNIIADLSANYCDRQIEYFFKRLKENLSNDFIFVVTADHGFPSYEQPPRPIVYNQTYTEAFHVPFILHGGEEICLKQKFLSNLDAVELVGCAAEIREDSANNTRDYILCEYGGPGCPDIANKEIWYTYIDEKYRVSVQCKLDEDITSEKIVAIFNLKKDPMQLKDLYHTKRNSQEVDLVLGVIRQRHLILRNKYAGNKFLLSQIDSINKLFE